MIELIDNVQTNVLHFKLAGVVTAKDYEDILIPAIKKKLETYKTIRVLYQVTKDFNSYEIGAMIDDAKAGLMFFSAWEKIAVVSDIEWIKNGVKIFSFVIPGEIKVFSNNDLEVAKKWLNQDNIDVFFDKKNKTITLQLNGVLTKDDFAYAKEIIDHLIEKYNRLNGVIIYTNESPGWESFGALVHHLKFVKDHHKYIKKLAVVTDSAVGDIAEKIGSHFVNAQIKHFNYANLKSAKDWIQQQ